MSERRTSDGRQGARPGEGGADPCGIRQAVTGVLDEPWPAFFSQWCRTSELGPIAARHVHAVAARLARPVARDGDDDPVARGWAAVRDALQGGASLEATA